MDRPSYSAYFDAATNRSGYFQDAAFSESGTSCQAFSRDVSEAAYVLCALRTDKTAKNFLQQSTVSTAIISPRLNSELLQRNASTAGNELDAEASASGTSESLTISHDKAYARSDKWKAYYGQSEKGMASRKAYEQSEKGKATRKAYRKAYRESEKGKAFQKAYNESEKGKASRKAYEQSEKRKASRKAYEQSEKRKAYQKDYQKTYQKDYQKDYQKAYRESEKGKAYQRAYKKAYKKAYNEVFKNTGDKEQAKIAGKQAASLYKRIK